MTSVKPAEPIRHRRPDTGAPGATIGVLLLLLWTVASVLVGVSLVVFGLLFLNPLVVIATVLYLDGIVLLVTNGEWAR